MIDHRGESRRFSRPRGADDEHETALRHGNVFHDLWQAELLHRLNFRFDMPEHQPDVAPLPEYIHPEPTQLLIIECQIHLHLFFELAALLATHQRQCQRLQLFIGERRCVGRLG